MSISDNKGENGFSTTRILFELFSVIPMLAQSPNDHLEAPAKVNNPATKNKRLLKNQTLPRNLLGVPGTH